MITLLFTQFKEGEISEKIPQQYLLRPSYPKTPKPQIHTLMFGGLTKSKRKAASQIKKQKTKLGNRFIEEEIHYPINSPFLLMFRESPKADDATNGLSSSSVTAEAASGAPDFRDGSCSVKRRKNSRRKVEREMKLQTTFTYRRMEDGGWRMETGTKDRVTKMNRRNWKRLVTSKLLEEKKKPYPQK